MEILNLEHSDAQIGLMIRDTDDPNNYALIRLEDLEKIIKFYNSFKKEFKKFGESSCTTKSVKKRKKRS